MRGSPQRHSLSCESCAAVALLSAYGRQMDEDEFFRGLPRSDNPDKGFVGDVHGPGGRLPPEGYGVHAEPVAARLCALGLRAAAERGKDAAWLRERLSRRQPVLVWVTGDFVPRTPHVARDREGEAFRAVPWEHAVLATGYTKSAVVVLDPATGRSREVPWGTFLAAWRSLDSMAVWVPNETQRRSAR